MLSIYRFSILALQCRGKVDAEKMELEKDDGEKREAMCKRNPKNVHIIVKVKT